MAVTLSGILKSGTGEVLSKTVITLASTTNTGEIVNGVRGSYTTDDSGAYSFECPVGKYVVFTQRPGSPVHSAGVIQVFSNSVNGSLNDYLTSTTTDTPTPEGSVADLKIKLAAPGGGAMVGSFISVDTLRANTSKFDVGSLINLRSYHEGLAKGGGTFSVVTSVATDNGGTHFVDAAGNHFERVFEGSAALFEWFGAKIDGVTDDYDAFVNCLNTCKKVRLSAGKMFIGKDVDVAPFIAGKYGVTLGWDIEGVSDDDSWLLFKATRAGFWCSTGKFFRAFRLANLTLANSNTGVGVGLRIQEGGSEMIRTERVAYVDWKIGRATHSWNSSYDNEVFRECGHGLVMYGTSSPTTATYVNKCTGVGYWIGFMLKTNTTTGEVDEIVRANVPLGYTEFNSLAADEVNTPYKIGNVHGVTINSPSSERSTGQAIWDCTDTAWSWYTSIVINNFCAYIQNGDKTEYVFLPPAHPRDQIVFNRVRLSLDYDTNIIAGNGAGINLNDVYYNRREWNQYSRESSWGFNLDGVSIQSDVARVGTGGFSIGSPENIPRLKHRKGITLVQQSTQALVFRGGLIGGSSGVAAGHVMCGSLKIYPINKGGNSQYEFAGSMQFSLAYESNDALNSDTLISYQRFGDIRDSFSLQKIRYTLPDLEDSTGKTEYVDFVLNMPRNGDDGHSIMYLIELELWSNAIFKDRELADGWVDETNKDFYVGNKVTSSFNATASATSIAVGKTAQITASALTDYVATEATPSGPVTITLNPSVVYESTDTTVATVSDTGVVTGVKAGVASIIAKSVGVGESVTLTFTVTA